MKIKPEPPPTTHLEENRATYRTPFALFTSVAGGFVGSQIIPFKEHCRITRTFGLAKYWERLSEGLLKEVENRQFELHTAGNGHPELCYDQTQDPCYQDFYLSGNPLTTCWKKQLDILNSALSCLSHNRSQEARIAYQEFRERFSSHVEEIVKGECDLETAKFAARTFQPRLPRTVEEVALLVLGAAIGFGIGYGIATSLRWTYHKLNPKEKSEPT